MFPFAAILNFAVGWCEAWDQKYFLVPDLTPFYHKIQNGPEKLSSLNIASIGIRIGKVSNLYLRHFRTI